jgi:hypothetical protein
LLGARTRSWPSRPSTATNGASAGSTNEASAEHRLDDYKRAQAELSRRQVEVEEIRRGVPNAPPTEKTLGDLFDYWIEKRAVRKRSMKDDESIIRKHLRPACGTMKLRDFSAEDVDGYVNAKIDDEELSDKMVSNHVALLGTMLRAAASFRIPWILHVPRLKKPRVSLFGTDYQWLRSDDEIRRSLTAAQVEDEHVFVFYAVAVFTGMRAGRSRRLSGQISTSSAASLRCSAVSTDRPSRTASGTCRSWNRCCHGCANGN